MRLVERFLRTLLVLGVFALSSYFALRFGPGGLWKGLAAAHAVAAPEAASAPYDLARIVAVNETLDTIHKKYVDPSRIDPRRMFLSALDHVQKEVAQVIVLHDEGSPSVRLRVDTEEREFRVDTIQAHWDVASRLREVFEFLQTHLKNTDVDLRHVEYAACNGILATLDPHSVFLSPEDFEEMNLSTTGHFGGLGIVISVRDQLLTVMRPMPGTPAGRAGLRRFDRITKINNESTLNMPLDDAVERLRGKPGSKVTVWVHRDGADGWGGAHPFELLREKIEIHSVHEHLLAPGIGYVRLEQFQSSTDTELEAALQKLSAKQPLSGLVLDLRGNPGGLLDRAIKVADLFLDQGVIVSTVGASEGTSESTAQRHGTQPGYPMVVLVSASSASASEIVAGALKNHERALVMGQTTFGKGSVQLVFPQMAGGAALKLTVAQYLTPGGISIQGVGVTPDIALDPMTADPLQMDLYRTEDPLRERDLSASLSNGAARGTVRPTMTLRYNLPIRERLEILERGGDMDDEFSVDFPVRIARDVVAKLQPGRRSTQLRSVKELLDRVQNEEITAVSTDLKRLGVDWSPAPLGAGQHAPAARAEDFVVKVETDRAKDTAQAGQPMTLAVTVENTGKAPLYRLRATTDSDSGYYTAKELVFGRLDPGQKRRATAPFGWCDVKGHKPGSSQPVPLDAQRECRLPFNAVTRQDVVKIHFEADDGEAPKDATLRPTVESLASPLFAYTFQVADNRPGNGDGYLAKGEGATVYLSVQNVGKGPSRETQANLRNLTGDGLLLRAGRFDVSNLAPGAKREVAFTFDVLDTLAGNLVKLELSVSDRDLDVSASEKLSIPVIDRPLGMVAASGAVSTLGPTQVRAQPTANGPIVGSLPPGMSVARLGTYADYTKVSLGDARFGFVPTASLGAGAPGGAGAKPGFEPLMTHSPPLLDVVPATLATRSGKVVIEGTATDVDQVLDAFIFVGSRKVFYRSNRKSSDPKRLRFSQEVELSPGINVIHVVARESEDTATRQTLVVRRDGPNGEPLPTPKNEVFGADWSFGRDRP